MSPGIYESIANYNPTGFAQQNARGALENQALQAGIPGIQAKSQQAQIEAQLMQRNLKDADIIQRAWINSPDDPEGYMIKNGISAPGFMQYRGSVIDLKQKLATTEKTTLENHATQSEQAGNLLREYQQNPGPDTWKQAASALAVVHPEAGYSPGVPMDPKQIPGVLAGLGMSKQLSEEALKAQQTKQSAATTAGEEQKNQLAALQAGLEKKARENPNDENAQLAAMTSEQRETLKVRQKEAELQIQRLNETITRQQQLYALERDRNERAQELFQLNNSDVMKPGSPVFGATPKDALASRAGISKAETDFTNSLASARAIHDFITQVRTGGPAAKAAARLLPSEGSFVLSTSNGSHRINRLETQSVPEMGTLYDKIVGAVKGPLTGVNISDSVLDSLEALYGQLASNASQKRADAYKAVDKSYSTHWANTLGAPSGPPEGGGGGTGGGGASAEDLLKRYK